MSSDDIVLSVKNISKRFEIYNQPRHRLQQMLFGRWKTYFQEFWALRNISFDVRKGESVGVIGKNGAGKSTLLQILVGTLRPTSGSVEVKGRVAALLELGSGFNPEFTGRENVYLNAAVLGLSKEETDAIYEEIVNFADIGNFIEQPVKTYSSGMLMRLAFAVQIKVKPDILIVDEALSVGDAAFQRKCFAHMEKLIKEGTTIFLVAHDTSAVKRFCQKCIFLKNGSIDYIGDVEEGITRYYQFLFPQNANPQEEETTNSPAPAKDNGFCLEVSGSDNKHKWGHGNGTVSHLRIWGLTPGARITTPGKIQIEVSANWNPEYLAQEIAKQALPENIVIGVLLTNHENIRIFGTNTMLDGHIISPYEKSSAVVCFELELPCLKPGDYFITAAISLGDKKSYFDLQWQDVCAQFSVSDNKMENHAGFVYMQHDTKLISTCQGKI